MFCGVSKAGSPALKPITSLPAAFSSFALSDMAMVGDGLMRCMRSAMKDMGGSQSESEEKSGATLMPSGGPCNARPRAAGILRLRSGSKGRHGGHGAGTSNSEFHHRGGETVRDSLLGAARPGIPPHHLTASVVIFLAPCPPCSPW